MKTISFIISLLVCMESFSQIIKYTDIGDQRQRGTFETYISKSGESYSIGDTLRIGPPTGVNGKYIYIENVDFIGDKHDVTASAINTQTVIKRISVGGARRSGFKVVFQSSAVVGNYYYFIEDAIESGEIRGKGMTSEEALAELRAAKEKLDLGLITQMEFEELREKLRKYIN